MVCLLLRQPIAKRDGVRQLTCTTDGRPSSAVLATHRFVLGIDASYCEFVTSCMPIKSLEILTRCRHFIMIALGEFEPRFRNRIAGAHRKAASVNARNACRACFRIPCLPRPREETLTRLASNIAAQSSVRIQSRNTGLLIHSIFGLLPVGATLTSCTSRSGLERQSDW